MIQSDRDQLSKIFSFCSELSNRLNLSVGCDNNIIQIRRNDSGDCDYCFIFMGRVVYTSPASQATFASADEFISTTNNFNQRLSDKWGDIIERKGEPVDESGS